MDEEYWSVLWGFVEKEKGGLKRSGVHVYILIALQHTWIFDMQFGCTIGIS